MYVMKNGTHSAMQSTTAIVTAAVQKSIAQLLPGAGIFECKRRSRPQARPGRLDGVSYRPSPARGDPEKGRGSKARNIDKMKRYHDIAGDGGSRILEQVAEQRTRIADGLAGVRHLVAVGSGKGGVGKST